ncbi:MAG: tRNA (adenosine(37)-N6)-dimethylallyltransferase MiaA [Bacteroidales bacterium]|nr:tRNA (adenosine(37)-N6)-dimethylallyltransferase MiaA [Bacteroidales bacterium]
MLTTLLVIAGPTAVGKTAFAIELAKSLDAVIISADSRQFYQELNIGTAKPSESELAAIKHFFVGHLSVNDYYNISRFEQDCLSILKELFVNKKVVLLVGGSGLYIDAVCNGVDEFPDPDPQIRHDLKKVLADKGIEGLRELLQKYDPAYYQQVDLSNPNRILRALEVCIETSVPYSEQRLNQSKTRSFNIIKIGLNLPRLQLFERINHRVDVMMQMGLLDEVKSLKQYQQLNALNTVGYKELFDYLDHKSTLEQAVLDIKTHSRRYAKRQLTWFRKDPDYHWFEPSQIKEVMELLNNLGVQ